MQNAVSHALYCQKYGGGGDFVIQFQVDIIFNYIQVYTVNLAKCGPKG